ncbi:ABC transporter substrate-binding protein [Protofrankia symbiont of Coriaria myrtifolia]|uniref:ABC transporter substrate-binding protein n=1 Tax=Protofrankia symbiont of Coriaria myrtifolia TaxID=1306540 RepID=UPI00104106BB|nr:ABC transporter substrate-binding protein [Protofrankia symbiont of Coriaria myrtifolia]
MSEKPFPPRRVAAAMVAALLALLALVACGGDTTGPSRNTTGSSASPAGPTTRTVVDMAGNSVTIPARPERIVTNYPAVTQIVFMLGGIRRMAGVPLSNLTTLPLFKKIYPPLADLPAAFGSDTTSVNAETLLAQKPDLVLLSAGNSSLTKKIIDLGIPAVQIAGFSNAEQLKSGVTLIASVLGDQDAANRAKQYVDYYDDAVRRAQDGTRDLTDAQRPKVYYTANNPLNTEGKGSIIDSWARTGGGRNIAADNGVQGTFKDVALETIASWNPDVIVCRDPSTCNEIRKDDRWSTVAAVRNNRVLPNPRGVFVWAARSAEAALQPLWVAKTLHPDRFQDVDISHEVKTFYSTFYSYNLTDAEVNEILNPVVS